MRSVVFVAILMLIGSAGCLEAAQDALEEVSENLDTDAYATWNVTPWQGHVLASALDGPSHMRPTEDLTWEAQQEGILFNIQEQPLKLQVALDWSGPADAKFLIMLHSHKAHGSNKYVEHITEMSSQRPQCLQVPMEDLTEGEWQVMIHSQDAVDADFELRIAMLGGEGSLVTDDRHGHWLQDGQFEVEEHTILPCETWTE